MRKITNFAAILMVSTILQSQTTIYVTPNGSGNGTSWADAGSLESAISVVERSRISTSLNDRTEIWVQKGAYYPTKMLVVPDSVKIYGGFTGTETTLSQRNFSANPTIVDGQQKIGSIFRLENSAELNGFTIQNGNANGNPQKNGGGVWANENGVIENCEIINNTAMLNGGGVYANGKVKIINSTIENNAANGSGSNTFGNCLIIKMNEHNSSPNTVAGCNPHIPDFGEVSFKTQATWTIPINGGEQIWSDVVMASGCNKTIYYGGASGSYYSDCRANSNRTTYGDLFSWCAVVRFAHVLCPDGWRVPTREDFIQLDKAMGGSGINGQSIGTIVTTRYIHNWGGVYGGVGTLSGLLYQGQLGNYWTSSEVGQKGYYLYFHTTGSIYPENSDPKDGGYALRCVK